MNQNGSIDENRGSWKREFRGVPVLLLLLIVAMAARCEFAGRQPGANALQAAERRAQLSTAYLNKEYGFRFDLPQDWSGFSVVRDQWNGTSPEHKVQNQSGLLIRLRHPKYTIEEPYEDIPIMVFTHKQWKNVQKEALVVSAAPFPPAEIGRNKTYVFATSPRFYYDFAKGYEEVLKILENRPLHTFDPANHSKGAATSNP